MLRAMQPAGMRVALLCCVIFLSQLLGAGFSTPATAADETAVAGETTRQATLQEQLDAVVAQQKVVEQIGEELQQRRGHVDEELELFRSAGFDQSPPYPLSMWDQLRDELEAEQARAATHEAALAARTEAVDKARCARDDKEKARRLAKEALDTAKDTAALPALKDALALAELESKLAAETLKLREAELANEKTGQEIQQQVLGLLLEKNRRVAQAVRFPKMELELRLAELRDQELETAQAIQSAELNQRYNDDRWADARRKFDTAGDNRALVSEELEAWRLARQKRQEELAVLNKRLQCLAEMRTAWNRRYSLLAEQPSADELRQWEEATEAVLEQSQREAILRRSQADQVRKDMAAVQAKLDNVNGTAPEIARWIGEQRRHLDELAKIYYSAIRSIEASQRLHQRLHDDLQHGGQAFSLARCSATAWQWMRSAWNYELIAVDDRPITTGKVVGGLLLFVVGFWLSRLVSRRLELRLRKRRKLNRDAAAVFKTLTFYTLLLVFTLFALRMVNLPLTAFTFAGGALAIGLGLGGQGLINNFLSGIVILAERPLRLGERIVYGGHDGIVEEIGYRCTKLRTMTGHLVTIPNSTILNEAVENIGRRPYIRRLFNVTVTYDTPRDKVEEAVRILRGIFEEPGIREPIHAVIGGEDFPPRVYFNELNADSLNIIVIYWFAPPEFWDYFDHAQRVNLRILEEFEKAGIDFAFPTQTLHLTRDAKRDFALRMPDDEPRKPAQKRA